MQILEDVSAIYEILWNLKCVTKRNGDKFSLLHSIDCFICIKDELLWYALQETFWEDKFSFSSQSFFGWWSITSVKIQYTESSLKYQNSPLLHQKMQQEYDKISLSHNLWQCKPVNCSVTSLQYNYFTRKWYYHIYEIFQNFFWSGKSNQTKYLVPWKCDKSNTTEIQILGKVMMHATNMVFCTFVPESQK